MAFRDRADAGRRLAERLSFLRGQEVVVLGLPRGGVPVAFEVAVALNAPLDIVVVRKLGVPFQPELGMGAVAEGDVQVINERVVRMADVSDAELSSVLEKEHQAVLQRAVTLRGDRPPLPLLGRTAVVVDDGMATGSTARAACRAARSRGASRVILAVPVASPEAVEDLGREAEVICIDTPHNLWAVGQWYRDFRPTSEAEVISLMAKAPHPGAVEHAGDSDPPDRTVVGEMGVVIDAGPVTLHGDLTVPPNAVGLVIFAHGSGSSRHSPRNRFVATRLNEAGLGTLLFDLLTPGEESDRRNVFDIDLLAGRLLHVTDWVRSQAGTRALHVCYFGASTGAAAALRAAAELGTQISAVVSRGGRPDLAGRRLSTVQAPTLLIVGGDDTAVLAMNREAQSRLVCENRLAVVPGATHLFEEPGTLAEASDLAKAWFLGHLQGTQKPAA